MGDRIIHPHMEHINSLPDIPGLRRSTVSFLTPAQFRRIFPDKTPPKKSDCLIIQCGGPLPLTRITRIPIVKNNDCRFGAEYFKKT